jgi:hypothetical protein
VTTGTIILYKYKYFIFNIIVPLSLYIPSPHKFYSVALQSSGLSNKSVSELILEMRNKKREYNINAEQFYGARNE